MTRIAEIRYYQGRVAYPSAEQLRAARATWDFDDVRRPTEDVDCTHIQLIEVSGRDVRETRRLEEETLARFFDYIGARPGFRVLTHETRSTSGRATAVAHEIVYVIESRPTKGYVKLKLRSEQTGGSAAGAASDVFGGEGFEQLARMFEQRPRRD
ncbi:MAG: hypothetical protein Q4C81_04005 [Kocuria sp.]|nr:hypothetical protein [Kocuria sp.]